jgi:hypothetical protein
MERPYILHMLSPLKQSALRREHRSTPVNAVVPYTNVELKEVAGLVQDAIFSRGPTGVKRTGLFIGGRQAGLALDMLAAARAAMFPPFRMSVFADPALHHGGGAGRLRRPQAEGQVRRRLERAPRRGVRRHRRRRLLGRGDRGRRRSEGDAGRL